MSSENIKNSNSLQLQQMIIYLKAELAKYKYEVKKHQDGYYYSLAEKLKQDNEQLTDEKNELTEELFRVNKELIKRTSDYKERIHSHEMQYKKQITTIDTLQQTKRNLWSTNKQLAEETKKIKDSLDTHQQHNRQVASLHSKIATYKTTIEQLEDRLVNLIQDASKNLQMKVEKLTVITYERTQSDKVQQHLLQEIVEKNRTIEKLQQELSSVKEQNDKLVLEIRLSQQNDDDPTTNDTSLATNKPTIDTETLIQLDHQIKKILVQSLEYEEKLATKLIALHTLEHKLDLLTVEIDEIKIFGVSGQITKEY